MGDMYRDGSDIVNYERWRHPYRAANKYEMS